MKVLLDIKDKESSFMFELFERFPFVKATPLTKPKEKFLKELKEAVKNVNLAKQGKLKAKPIKELLDEI